jgi:uncharacterized membrane protein YkvA (DUF1232 family)
MNAWDTKPEAHQEDVPTPRTDTQNVFLCRDVSATLPMGGHAVGSAPVASTIQAGSREAAVMWWSILLSVIAGLVLIYLVLLGLLWQAHRRHPETITARDTLRLLPDLVRLFRRLAADPDLPRGMRIRLMLLLAYLISPLDLIPDFVPVLGYADDVIIVAIALRSVTRKAGPDALERHWPGTPQGLQAIRHLARI